MATAAVTNSATLVDQPAPIGVAWEFDELSGVRPLSQALDGGLLPTLAAPEREARVHHPVGSFFDEPSPMGSRMGAYELLEQIGHGAMGTVYRARHAHSSQAVAVKVLRPELARDPEHCRRFFGEASLPRRVQSAHVMQPYGTRRTSDGSLYMAMPLLDGCDLAKLLEREPLNLATALSIARRLSEILSHVHAAGIIHRDIKPANVHISRPDGRLNVTLIDFGIALDLRSPNAEDASERKVLGSPPYLSPEQAAATDADQRSDIYAVGALLFESITGDLVFEGQTVHEMLLATATQQAPKVSSRRWIPRSIRDDLDALVARCLDKDPNKRPATARELERRLRHIESAFHNLPRPAENSRTKATFLPERES